MTKHHQGGGDLGFHLEISAIVGIRLCLIELDVLLKYKSSSCSPTILSKPASSMRDRQMKCIYGLEGVCPPLALQVGAKYSISVIFKICLKRNQYWNVLGWLAAKACSLPIPLLGANKQNLRRNSKRIFGSSAICR